MGKSFSIYVLLFFAISVRSQPNPLDLLVSRLFKDYNNFASPYANRRNSTSHVEVLISLSHAVIDNVNERDWTIGVLTLLTIRWVDPRLQWDPSLFDEIAEISVKESALWKPEIFLCKSAESTNVSPDFPSAMIRYTGEVSLDVFHKITYSCQMVFDDFPFDVQQCQICYGLSGISGATVDLIDVPPARRDIVANSEWFFVGNISVEKRIAELNGVHKDRLNYNISLSRRSFFWVALIIVPTCLICIVALVGIFFAGEGKVIDNAVAIGLTTMTSLMLVVTILADSLAKADNLPGLGWFVLYDIGIVCVAAIVALVLDHSRSLAISSVKKKRQMNTWTTLLVSKRAYRAVRVILFIICIVGLALNVVLRWSANST
ncbi:hypothetical protein PRIPAC_77090 [Pristionchus pacificus]|uniref:Transmembrane ion channel n=1 Tax=Pristionchus pacificus TaxID=54126 RepID=A0A2A6CKP2_PRIPA|nr:hypothetical protein PRIPAC_77090 [Pristionchus pacificus]|eukprot:PDM78795.1 transmembrane ion channel [Pristionchus pacificus]